MRDWELKFNDSPGFEERIIFRLIDNGAIVEEFGLDSPDHGKLYYALKDWFND